MTSTPTSAPADPPREVVFISHSTIFYWWPVWLAGFLMAALSYLDGHQMALVPVGTVAETSAHGRSSVAGGQPPWASARVFRDDVADEGHGKEGRIIRVRPPSRS
jgi:hypothetical protein